MNEGTEDSPESGKNIIHVIHPNSEPIFKPKLHLLSFSNTNTANPRLKVRKHIVIMQSWKKSIEKHGTAV